MEAFKGWLTKDGNLGGRVKAQASFTARHVRQAVAKAELSEPTAFCRKAEDYQTKVTLGITGWWVPRVHINGSVRHLDVGSSHPGGEVASKGLAVRQLKRFASWVQTVYALMIYWRTNGLNPRLRHQIHGEHGE